MIPATHEKIPLRYELTLRGVVTFSRSNLRLIRHSAHLYANSAKPPIACFVCRVITQTVLRANLGSHLGERSLSILQTGSDEIPATTGFRQIVHLAASEIVETTANLHALKWSHLAKIC